VGVALVNMVETMVHSRGEHPGEAYLYANATVNRGDASDRSG
jgi:hypothetical protein